MTWLKGQTTWGNLVDKLTKLMCGEVADDAAVTVDPSEQWIREIAGQDLLRAPASEDYAQPDMSNRAGYWTLYTTRYNSATPGVFSFSQSVVRQTAKVTSNPSTTAGRWSWMIAITTANTVAGDYSTLRFQLILYDADTGAQLANSSNLAPNAAGNYTIPTYGGTLAFSDPSGIIPAGLIFFRSFTTVYQGGIDFWPTLSWRSGAWSFTVNPAGVSGTDWDVVEIPVGHYPAGTSNWIQWYGGASYGLGIKTNTGLSGNLYTVTWPIAMKFRLYARSGANNGQICIEWGGGGKVDTVYQNPTYRAVGSLASSQAHGQHYLFLRPYQTPGSVTAGSQVQYWLCVRRDRIAVILNADPGQTGKLTCNWMGKLTPYYPAWDVFPWLVGNQVLDYTADLTGQYFYVLGRCSVGAQKFRLDGSEGRDWQTGWMRFDFGNGQMVGAAYADTYGQTNDAWGATLGAAGWSTNSTGGLAPPNSNKPSQLDGKWWMWGWTWFEDGYSGTGSAGVTAGPGYDVGHFPRGKTTDGCLFIPSGAWASGDELTDTVTGKKYFLVAADYHGIGYRLRTAANAFAGGAAVLEE